jgi:ribosomal protein S18 acetylase RimI-like enzyme
MEISVLDHRDPGVAEEVVAVQRAAYAVEAELIGFDDLPPLREEPEALAEADLLVLGAHDGPDLVGVLGYERDGDVVEIDRLAVRPAAFRRGVARSLLDDLHTREGPDARFAVSTGAANEPAIALYRSLGYLWVADEPLAVGITVSRFVRP